MEPMGLTAEESSAVLQRIAAGDPGALEAGIDRFGGLVWSIARKFLRSGEDAEEAVQDVFAQLWKHAERFDPDRASATTFVTMIARRRMIDRSRRAGRRAPTEGGAELDAIPAEARADRVEQNDDIEKVTKAFVLLRPEQREALRLSVYHGLSHRQIADQLDLPLGTVKTHVRRGLIRIRELLGLGPPLSSEGPPA